MSEHDVLELTNPTDQDFTHAFGGQPLTIKAYETKSWQRNIVEHMAKHLVNRILLEKGHLKDLYTCPEREEEMERVLGGIVGNTGTEEKTMIEEIEEVEEKFSTEKPVDRYEGMKRQELIKELKSQGKTFNVNMKNVDILAELNN